MILDSSILGMRYFHFVWSIYYFGYCSNSSYSYNSTTQVSFKQCNVNGNSWSQTDMDTHINIVWHTIWLLPSFRLSHYLRSTQHNRQMGKNSSHHLQPTKFSEWIGNVNVNVTWMGWDGITFYYNNCVYLGSAINILQYNIILYCVQLHNYFRVLFYFTSKWIKIKAFIICTWWSKNTAKMYYNNHYNHRHNRHHQSIITKLLKTKNKKWKMPVL